MFFRETGDEFGAEAVGAAAFVEDDEASCAGEGTFDGVEFQRRERAEIEEVEGLFIFGGEIIGGCLGEVNHFTVGHEGCEVAGAELPGRPDGAVVGVPGHGCFSPAVEGFVLKKKDGVVVFVGGEEGVERILRRARVEGLEAGHREQKRVEFLRMERAESEATAGWQAEDDGDGGTGTKVVGGGVERDLRRSLGDEIGELEFFDGAVAVECEADCVACAGTFGERGIEDARSAEVSEESVGHFEGPAVGRNILAEDERLGALGEDFPVRSVEGLGEVELSVERSGLSAVGAERRDPREGRGRRREEVGLHGRDVADGTRRGEGDFHAGFEEFGKFRVDGVESSGAQRGGELRAKFRQRISREKTVGLAGLQIVARIIRSMTAESQGVGLDEHGPRRGADFLDGGGERAGRSGNVGRGVEGKPFDAVAGSAAPKLGVGRELLGNRR